MHNNIHSQFVLYMRITLSPPKWKQIVVVQGEINMK